MKKIIVLCIMSILLPIVLAQEFDVNNPKEWLEKKQSVSNPDYAKNFAAAVKKGTLSEEQATTIFQRNSLTAAKRAEILAASDNPTFQKKLLLGIKGEKAQQKQIDTLIAIKDPEKQFALLEALTKDDDGKTTGLQYKLLNEVMKSDVIPFALKAKFFALSGTKEGIDLNQFKESFIQFATQAEGLGLKSLIMDKDGVLVGNIQFVLPDNCKDPKACAFLKNGEMSIEIKTIVGSSVQTTKNGFVITKEKSFEINGDGKLITKGERLVLQGKKGQELDISAFLEGQEVGEIPKLRFESGVELGKRDVFSVHALDQCVKEKCSVFHITKTPEIKAEFGYKTIKVKEGGKIVQKGMVIVSEFDESGTFVRKYAIDQAKGGETELKITKESGKNNFHFQNREGETIISVLDSSDNPIKKGLRTVRLFEKADYVSTFDRIRDVPVQVVNNGILDSVYQNNKGTIVNEVDARGKITFYYAENKHVTKDEFDKYSVQGKSTAEKAKTLQTVGETYLSNALSKLITNLVGPIGPSANADFERRERDRINVVIVRQSVDTSDPQLWVRADFADGTTKPIEVITKVGESNAPARTALVLNADVELKSAFNEEAKSYEISPKVYLLPKSIDGDTPEERKNFIFTKKDNYVLFGKPPKDRGWQRGADQKLYKVLGKIYERNEKGKVIDVDKVVTAAYRESSLEESTGKTGQITGASRTLVNFDKINAEPESNPQMGKIKDKLIEGFGFETNKIGRVWVSARDDSDFLFKKADVEYSKTTGRDLNRKGIGKESIMSYNPNEGIITKLYFLQDGQKVELQGQLAAPGLISAAVGDGQTKLESLDETTMTVNGIEIKQPNGKLEIKDQKITLFEIAGGLVQKSLGKIGFRGEKAFISSRTNPKGDREIKLQFDGKLLVGSESQDITVKINGQPDRAKLEVTTGQGTDPSAAPPTVLGTATVSLPSQFEGLSIEDLKFKFGTEKGIYEGSVVRGIIEEAGRGIKLSSDGLGVKTPKFGFESKKFSGDINIGDELLEFRDFSAQDAKVVTAEVEAKIKELQAQRVAASTKKATVVMLEGITGQSGELARVITAPDGTKERQVIAQIGTLDDVSGIITKDGKKVTLRDIKAGLVKASTHDTKTTVVSSETIVDKRVEAIKSYIDPDNAKRFLKQSNEKQPIVEPLQRVLIDQKLLTEAEIGGDFGYYGPKTERAVKELQRNLGFTEKDVDGIIGSKTILALEKATTQIIPGKTVTDKRTKELSVQDLTGRISIDLSDNKKLDLDVAAQAGPTTYHVNGKPVIDATTLQSYLVIRDDNVKGMIEATDSKLLLGTTEVLGDVLTAEVNSNVNNLLNFEYAALRKRVEERLPEEDLAIKRLIQFGKMGLSLTDNKAGELEFRAATNSLLFKTFTDDGKTSSEFSLAGVKPGSDAIVQARALEDILYLDRVSGLVTTKKGDTETITSVDLAGPKYTAETTIENKIIVKRQDGSEVITLTPELTKAQFDLSTFEPSVAGGITTEIAGKQFSTTFELKDNRITSPGVTVRTEGLTLKFKNINGQIEEGNFKVSGTVTAKLKSSLKRKLGSLSATEIQLELLHDPNTGKTVMRIPERERISLERVVDRNPFDGTGETIQETAVVFQPATPENPVAIDLTQAIKKAGDQASKSDIVTEIVKSVQSGKVIISQGIAEIQFTNDGRPVMIIPGGVVQAFTKTQPYNYGPAIDAFVRKHIMKN